MWFNTKPMSFHPSSRNLYLKCLLTTSTIDQSLTRSKSIRGSKGQLLRTAMLRKQCRVWNQSLFKKRWNSNQHTSGQRNRTSEIGPWLKASRTTLSSVLEQIMWVPWWKAISNSCESTSFSTQGTSSVVIFAVKTAMPFESRKTLSDKSWRNFETNTTWVRFRLFGGNTAKSLTPSLPVEQVASSTSLWKTSLRSAPRHPKMLFFQKEPTAIFQITQNVISLWMKLQA